MKLSEQQKTKLLQTAKKVYSSYLALDVFKNKLISVQNTEPDSQVLDTSLLSLVQGMRRQSRRNIQKSIMVAGKLYDVYIQTIDGEQTKYRVRLQYPIAYPNLIKVPNAYTDEESGYLLANKDFILEETRDGKVAVSLALDEQHQIGGPSKYDLYPEHLVTLFNIINKIQTEDDISNLLVALATGSGKTFVQGLWLYILHLAGFNSVFAIPDRLITQFHKDLGRLLPDTVIGKIMTLRDNSDDVHPGLGLSNQSGQILVASSNRLLDDAHYQDVLNLPPDNNCLIFDEQHLVMAEERASKRLLTLSQRFLSMLLTATPNRETYDLAGRRPVAMMSSGQKEKAGRGQFPKVITMQSESLTELNSKIPTNGLSEWLKKIGRGLFLRFDTMFQDECSSAIHSIFEKLPYVVEKKTEEKDLQWRLRMPMANKILCVINNNEALVNCCHYLKPLHVSSPYGDTNYLHRDDIYHNGNFVVRASVAKIFGLPDAGGEVLHENQQRKRAECLEQLTEDEQDKIRPLLQKGLSNQLQSNMFHYLVEYVLSDLTGLTTIEQDGLRKQSATEFCDLIVRNYKQRDQAYYQEKLGKVLDANGAQEIAALLTSISATLGAKIKTKSRCLLQFTDNWFLADYEDLADVINAHDDCFLNNFSTYAQRYLVMGIMTGMEDAETPIQDLKPFLGLSERRYRLYDEEEIAKKRQRTSIELLNDRAEESIFTPQYVPEITPDIADNYFRLGFVGMYVSNIKSEGYNDLDLHTVINAIERTYDTNNSPTSLNQIGGRVRGMHKLITPYIINGLGHRQHLGFDYNLLKKDDYLPELFAAQEQYNEGYISVLGEQVGQDIITWYHQHQDSDESIDADQLKRQVLRFIASALRHLNMNTNHKISLSRAQLPQVIAHAMAKLDKEIANIRNPYSVSFVVRAFGTVLNFICECYFTVLRIKPWFAMRTHAQVLAKAAQARTSLNEQTRASSEGTGALRTAKADAVYMKIIRQVHFKDLVAQTLVAAEFKSWVTRKVDVSKTLLKKSVLSYVKPEVKAQIQAELQRVIFPLIECMVVPEKRDLVREQLLAFDGLPLFLKTNAQRIKSLADSSKETQLTANVLKLFHQIPGLECIQANDIVNEKFQVRSSWTLLNNDSRLRAITEEEVVQFMQTDLDDYLSAWVAYPDKVRVISALQGNSERLRAFVQFQLAQNLAEPGIVQFEQSFAQFQQTFDLHDVALLNQKALHTQEELQAYQIASIADIMRRELFPCLVNFYPLDARARLLTQITQDKLEKVLITEREDIEALLSAQTEPAEKAAYFFSKLCTNVPAQINLIDEQEKSKAFFAEHTTKPSLSTLANVASLGIDRLTMKLSGSDAGLLSGRLQKVLSTPEFFNAISLLLPYHHWQELQQRFRTQPENVKKLAQQLAATIQGGTECTPELLLSEINTAFVLDLKNIVDYGGSVANELMQLAQGEKMLYTTAAQKQRLVRLIQEECLPLLASYMRSDDLKAAFLSQSHDAEQLCEFFSTHCADFQIIAKQNDGLHVASVFELLNQLSPELCVLDDLVHPKAYATVQAQHCEHVLSNRILKRRAKDFEVSLETMLNPELPIFDQEKVADMVLAQILPVLGHSQFRNSLALYMGSLTQNDLQIMFEALNMEDAEQAAQDLLRFKTLITIHDFATLKQEFMLGNPDEKYDFASSPLKKVLDNFTLISEEVYKCHCYYQQHDAKGQQTMGVRPKLYNLISNDLKSIRVAADPESFMSRFSRKIFFIQGVRNGLPLAGKVFAESLQKTVKVLQRIKNHLFRPLWWSVNTSYVFYAMVASAKNGWNALKSIFYTAWNGLKIAASWVLGRSAALHPTAKNTDSIDFSESAFDLAKTINSLESLSPVAVVQRDCPKDAIKFVEQEITQRSNYKVRLFERANAEHPVVDNGLVVSTRRTPACV